MTTNDDTMYVRQRIKDAMAYVKDWHNNIDRWRKLYDGNHYDVPAGGNETRYNDPTYLNTVDLSVGIMLGNQLTWKASGWSPSYEEQRESGALEKFLAGAWHINSEREESNLLYELFLHFNRDGGAAIFSVWDGNIADSMETVKIPDAESETGTSDFYLFRELPLRIKVIDPRTLFMLPGGPKRWLVMGRIEQRSVLDVEMQYRVEFALYKGYTPEQKASAKANFIDYWDYSPEDGSVRNCCLFADEVIPGYELRKMEGYDELPYTVQFFKPTSRSETNKWHSILSPLFESVTMLERSINRRQRQIDVYSSLPIVTKTHPGRTVTVEGLGNHVPLSTDEEISFPVWPGNAPDVELQIELFRSRIQQSGFSDVMFGSGQSQIAGYALSQLGDQNRIRLEQPITHLELLFSTWARKVIKLSSYYSKNSKIIVYGTLKGLSFMEMVDLNESKDYLVTAQIQPQFPNEEVRRHAMATQARGVLSEHTLMEKYYNIQQPEDEMERRNIEQAMKHPLAQTYAMMVELKRRADLGDEIAQKTLNSLENGQAPNGMPGRPKEPNAPEPLTGTASPGGGLPPQAAGGLPPGASAQEQINGMAGASPDMSGGISGY